MNYRTHKTHGFFLVLLTILMPTGILIGQEDNSHNEQVTIIGSIDPSINEAYKINQQPKAGQLSLQHPEFEFNYLDKQTATKITLEPITPAKINVDKRKKTYKNLLVAGIGSLFSPYVNFLHSAGRRNSYRFTTQIYHLSAFRNIPEYTNPYTNTSALLNYEKFSGNHIINTGFQYKLNTNRFYGFVESEYQGIDPDDSNLKQMFNLMQANVGIRSNYKNNKKLFHSISLSGYYYFDRYKTSEANADLPFDFYKSFDVTKALNYQYLGLKGKVTYFRNSDTLITSSDLFVNLTPYFKARYGIVNFRLGLSFSYLNTTEGSLHFYPELDATVELIPDRLTIYAGIDGGLEKNSFYLLADENPYVSSTIDTRWKNNKFSGYAGIRGNIGQKIGFNIEGGWTKFDNEYFFVNTYFNAEVAPNGPLNKFDVVYDAGSVWHIGGEVNYTYDTKFKTWLRVRYNSYTLDSLSQPYHKPITEIKLGASYLIKKVNIWTELYYSGKRYAFDPRWSLPSEITLDPFVDINLGVDYQLKDNFTVFLKLTNLLNHNYEIYYNYPTQGINVMAGIKFKF